jgi:hypothetical protein
MQGLQPQDEFIDLSEDEVMAALAKGSNPISSEVMRLFVGYSAKYAYDKTIPNTADPSQPGALPPILVKKVTTPIERVAMSMWRKDTEKMWARAGVPMPVIDYE